MNILFICTGNTCRSPMAEGLMNKIALDNDLDIHAYSAGIFAQDSFPASEEAIEASKKYDVDITHHKSKPLTEDLLLKSDLILTMTNAHKQLLSGIAKDKIFTINEYANLDGDISDPFGGDIEEYEKVCEEIYDAIIEIIEKLSDKLLQNNQNSGDK